MTQRAAFLLLLALLAVAGCTDDADTGMAPGRREGLPAYGDTLVTGSIGEASTLIPLLASDAASHTIAGYIYNGLLKYDKNLNLVGDLAESWEVSPDGLVITFHLRRGVKWQDGQEFTARDVLYTYRVTIDPKTPTAYAEDFKQVTEGGGARPLYRPGDLRPPLCPGPGLVGDEHPPGTPPGRERDHQERTGAQTGGDRPVPLQGVGGRAEDSAGGL